MIELIKSFLIDKKNLDIAGFGSFDVSYQSATIQPIVNKFSKPGYRVFFRMNSLAETTPDFIKFVQNELGLSEQIVLQQIASFVAQIEANIEQGSPFLLGTMGHFERGDTGKPVFIAAVDTDFSPDSFGLEDFDIPHASSQAMATQQENKPKTQPVGLQNPISQEVKGEKKRSKSPVKVVLLSLLALLFLCLLTGGILYAFYPVLLQQYQKDFIAFWNKKTGRETTLISAMEPLADTSATFENTEIIADSVVFYNSINDSLKEDNIEELEVKLEEKSMETAAQKEVATQQKGNYYIIVGSFQEESNAQKFMQEKQSQYANLSNLGRGKTSNLYLIGLGPYTKEEAQKLIIEKTLKGWLLKK